MSIFILQKKRFLAVFFRQPHQEKKLTIQQKNGDKKKRDGNGKSVDIN